MDTNCQRDDDMVDQSPAADQASSTFEDSKNPTPPAITTTKKDRRRLKKLRKKYQQDGEVGERSGFLNRVEWMEYKRLETSPSLLDSVGPAIRRRKRQNTPARKVFEGTHHRDILACLFKAQTENHDLQQPTKNSNPKKRPRNGETDDPIQSTTLPGWVNLHNPGALEHIVVLELRVGDIEKYSSKVESAVEHKEGRRPMQCMSVPTRWFQGSIPKSSSESLLYFVSSLNNKMKQQTPTASPINREHILAQLQLLTLSEDDMQKEDYPIPINGAGSGSASDPISMSPSIQDPTSFAIDDATSLIQRIGVQIENQECNDGRLYVETQRGNSESDTHAARVIGLDCEMVKTAKDGSELARITMVEFLDFQEDAIETNTILDAFVKPYNVITDYVTEYSGITSDLLDDVTTRLEQVQASLVTYLRPNDILVGHSLENDLHALRYIHPNVIDTALLFRHGGQDNKRRRGCKHSLRHLTAVLLQRKIQADSHCSEQDSVAALELAVRRACFGDIFCIRENKRKSLLGCFPQNESTVGVCIGPGTWLKQHVTSHSNGIHALDYRSIPDCKRALMGWLTGRRRAQLVWSLLDIESTKDDLSGEIEALVVSCAV